MRLMQEFHEFDHTEPFDDVPAKKAMEKVISDERVGLVWLIKSSGEGVGYIVLTLHYRLESRGTCANLDELFINEANRGQGIGRIAMEFLEDTCKGRIIRELPEMSQKELAKETGIPQSTISAIENNRVNLGVERAKQLAIALKCHPAVLVFPGWDVHNAA